MTDAEQQLAALRIQPTTAERRLSRPYDVMCAGKLNTESFARKECEYREDIANIKSTINEMELESATNLDAGFRILELAKQL